MIHCESNFLHKEQQWEDNLLIPSVLAINSILSIMKCESNFVKKEQLWEEDWLNP